MSEHQEQTQVFQNENFTATFTKHPFCRYELSLTLTPQLKKIAHAEAIRVVSKEVSIPGFRKGKAPVQWILDKYKSQVEHEALDIAVNKALNEALKLAELYPIKQTIKSSKADKFSIEGDTQYKLSFETFPKVPSINMTDIKLSPISAKEITDKDIQERLHGLRIHHATFQPVTDRGIQYGDFVDFSMIHSAEGQVANTTNHEKVEFTEVTTATEEVLKQMLGMKTGEERNITINDQAVEVSNAVLLKGIFSAQLPEVDEEFVKKFGAESPEDLKKKVEARMGYEVMKDYTSNLKNSTVQKLLDLYHFEIPHAFFDQEWQQLKKQHIYELKDNGYSDEWIASNEARINEAMQRQAEGKIRLIYLTHQFAEEHNLKPSEEEISQSILYHKAYLGGQKVDEERLRHQAIQDLTMNKVIEFLATNATIEEKE